MTFETFDVVTVPFPFVDATRSKNRPALVLSSKDMFNNKIGHSVLAMITSAENTPWPLDVPITDLVHAGLRFPSVIRMKLFTLDDRFIIAKIGALSKKDQAKAKDTMKALFKSLLG